MVKCSYEQKPFRREVMRTYGADVTPSPSHTRPRSAGRSLQTHPGTTGISRLRHLRGGRGRRRRRPATAMCSAACSIRCCCTSRSSVWRPKAALDKYGVKPDIIIGCAGGGSNLGGLIAPFMGEKLRGEQDYRIIAVEPASCPSFTRGKFAYDFCDTGMVCPLAKMYTLGSGFIPSANHAGGLRYHGMSSTLSQLYHDGLYGGARRRADERL